MKQTRTCPKCGGQKIIKVDGDVRAYGAGNNVMVGMTIFSAVKVNRYVCRGCGYSEEWIGREDLPKLEEKFGIQF